MSKFDTLIRWVDHSIGFQDNWDIVFFKPEFLTVQVLENMAIEEDSFNRLWVEKPTRCQTQFIPEDESL